MENNGYGSSSVPDNAAVLPTPEDMMSGSTVFNIPTGLPPVDNIMPNLGWAAAAGNMDMLGRGGLPMNVSTYSGFSTAWPPAENMPNLGWTATGNMDDGLGLGLGGPPMTVSTYPSISTVWTSTGNMDILGSPITVSTVENMANLNMPTAVLTECPPVAVTSEAGPSMMSEIEKAVSRSPYKGASQEGIMFAPDLQDQQSRLNLSGCITKPLNPSPSEDSTRFWVKVESKKDLFKFPLDLPTMDGLKTQVLKRLTHLEADGLKFMYQDEDGEMITIACEEDLHFCFQYFKSSFHKTKVRLSLVANDDH